MLRYQYGGDLRISCFFFTTLCVLCCLHKILLFQNCAHIYVQKINKYSGRSSQRPKAVGSQFVPALEITAVYIGRGRAATRGGKSARAPVFAVQLEDELETSAFDSGSPSEPQKKKIDVRRAAKSRRLPSHSIDKVFGLPPPPPRLCPSPTVGRSVVRLAGLPRRLAAVGGGPPRERQK